MEIFLVRHTSLQVEPGLCYGQSEIPLKETFQYEFLSLTSRLPQSVDAIYTSPLARCRTLAAYIGTQLKVDYKSDARLAELNFGEWEMKSWDEIDRSSSDWWMDDYIHRKCPHGESYLDLYQRIQSFYQDVFQQHQRILLVTHAGVIRAFYALCQQKELKDTMDIPVNFGEVHTLNSIEG